MIAQSRRRVRRDGFFALAFATALLMPLVPGGAYAASFCVPGDGDKPETSLQGGLTVAERNIAGGFQGQWCGMRQVGHEPLGLRGSFGDVQLMGLCAYASMRDPSNLTLPTTGTAVIDMRVPSAPVWTQTLRSPAMQRAYSALEIQKLVGTVAFASGVRVRVRIGLNTGPVIGVTIGAENRLHYTLLGDAVNVASRVEQLNKQFGSLILATESTVRAAGDGFPCVRLGETGVRGHRGDVVVYRVDPA